MSNGFFLATFDKWEGGFCLVTVLQAPKISMTMIYGNPLFYDIENRTIPIEKMSEKRKTQLVPKF